jgi:hypothetical protein
MSCMLSEPPPGEVTMNCATCPPALPSSGKYASPCSTWPVTSIQFSMKAACMCATAGPSRRKCVSRQCSGSCALPRQFVGDADAAGIADAPVDHHDLAMRAVVDGGEGVPAQRVVLLDFHPGGLHLLDRAVVDLAAAEGVEQHVHLHAGFGALGKRAGELRADLARPVDVALEGDGAARAADRLQHVAEDLVAVEQGLRAIAAEERRAEHHIHGAPELRIGDRVERLDALLDALVAEAEIRDQQHDERGGDERLRHDPGLSAALQPGHPPASHKAG